MVNRLNWWQLSSIQIGAAVCLPTLMVSQEICKAYGFTSAIAAIIIGNAILLFLGLISAKMSCEKQKTTVENALEYFGEKGTTLFAAMMGITLLSWFGLQLNLMSLSVLDLFSIEASRDTWLIILNAALGLIITLVALYGMRALNLLADLSLPLLIGTLAYALFTAEQKPFEESEFSLGGISLVIAIYIAGVINLPTYFRHARSLKDGILSAVIIFGVALPVLEIVGIYLTLGHAQGTILDVLKRHDSTLWNLWIALFLILAGWTTNNLNLYSIVDCFNQLIKNQTAKGRTLLGGGLGTFLACFNPLNHLEIVLSMIGILVISMGGVILARYSLALFNGLAVTKQDERWHLAALLLGIGMGFYGILGYSLTSIPVLDAALGAGLGTCLILTKGKVVALVSIFKKRNRINREPLKV